jgi:flavin-dependent dehydrogenase
VLTGKTQGAILPRRRFDQVLVNAAVRAGVRFEPEVRVDELLMEAGRVVGVGCGAGQIAARTVIVANGGNSRFNADPRPKHLVHTCMAWYEGLPFTPNVMELVYDPDLLPHFGWLFPESDGRANVGVAVFAERLGARSIRDVLASFIERRLAASLNGATQLGPWKGIPLSTTIDPQHHAPHGALIVGEANRLTNCATGEGILYAILSGRMAAQAVSAGKERGLGAAEVERLYADGLRRAFRRPFRQAHFYCKLGMRALNAVVMLSKIPPVNRSLANLFSGL